MMNRIAMTRDVMVRDMMKRGQTAVQQARIITSRRITSRNTTSRCTPSRFLARGSPLPHPLPTRQLRRAFHGVARDAPPEEVTVATGGKGEGDLLAGQARLGELRALEAAARD